MLCIFYHNKKVNCKYVWEIWWLQENSRTISMFENNAYLNLGESEILQYFSLLAKFTKLNGTWIILYPLFHD